MASRRLKSDRFLASEFNADVYSQAGLDWINENTMKTILLRHCPSLGPLLRHHDNAFAPWTSVDALRRAGRRPRRVEPAINAAQQRLGELNPRIARPRHHLWLAVPSRPGPRGTLERGSTMRNRMLLRLHVVPILVALAAGCSGEGSLQPGAGGTPSGSTQGAGPGAARARAAGGAHRAAR